MKDHHGVLADRYVMFTYEQGQLSDSGNVTLALSF